jgi:hypothetical protein
MRILALTLLALAVTSPANAQRGYMESDLSGDWQITFRGRTAPITLEADSGWIMGSYQDRGQQISVGMRGQDGATVFIEITIGDGDTANCEAEIQRGERRVVGACDPGGALELTR